MDLAVLQRTEFWRGSALPRRPQPNHPCLRLCRLFFFWQGTGHQQGTLVSRAAFRTLIFRAGHYSVTCTVWRGLAGHGMRTCTARSNVAATTLPSVPLALGLPLRFHLEMKGLSSSRPVNHTYVPVWPSILLPTTTMNWEEKKREIHLLPPSVQASTMDIKAPDPLHFLFLKSLQIPPTYLQDPLEKKAWPSYTWAPFARRKTENF